MSEPKLGSICTQIFAPISWSAKDTTETIKQIKKHNAVWELNNKQS